jgi:GT2 family glycosyltransferase
VDYISGRAGHIFKQEDEPRLQYITATSILLRAAAIKHVGLLDSKSFFMYWEDVDLSFRLRKAGWKLSVAGESIIFHKKSASVGNNSPLLDYYYNASAIRFFIKNYRFPFIPIVLGASGRLVKRLLSRDKQRIISTLKGIYSGFKEK